MACEGSSYAGHVTVASTATCADIVVVSHIDGHAEAGSAPSANRRLRIAVAAWTVVGVVGGVTVSNGPFQAVEPLSRLTQVAGFVTGAVIGLSGLTAVSAGLLAYALTVALVQILAGMNAAVIVASVWGGTSIVLGASVLLLLGAGARYLVGLRHRPRGVAAEPAVGTGTAEDVGSVGSSGLRVSTAGRWAAYWLLAVVIFPVVNLPLGFLIISWLGGGTLLLGFPLFLAGESVALRRLVRTEASGPRRLGFLTTAGLVFVVTVGWTFVLFLIALSQPNAFTF